MSTLRVLLVAAALSAAAARAQEATLGPDVEATIGPPSGVAMTGEALTQRLEELARHMRCPVCQGHSIADSPSESARNMKAQVRTLLAAGYDEEQIFSYFEAGYGEFIRMTPRPEGWNLLAWAIPIAGGALGLGAAAWVIRRKGGAPEPGVAERIEPAAEADELEPWIEKVRKAARDESR